MDLSAFLSAGGILLGFQVTSLGWRITEEAKVARNGDITWLPPADYLNMLAMAITSSGIFVLPAIGIDNIEIIRFMFGLGAILYVGHSISLVGHYELFNHKTKRTFSYFPFQEIIAVSLTLIASVLYIVMAWS